MISVQAIKPCVGEAIDAMESYQLAAGNPEALNLSDRSALFPFIPIPSVTVFEEQARLVWQLSVQRKIPLVWLVQSNTVANLVFNLLCFHAKLSVENVVEGNWREEDFGRMTWAAGSLAGAPLGFCEIDDFEAFKAVAIQLANENDFTFVLCDWYLSRAEWEAAEILTQSGCVSFLSPN